ncbi:hypothetical protein H4582DRAFT_1590148 [Lactarius indigo]|nr:hypothetical protein H4582DRAFT_1590148 [Lactarius indigo]
MRKYLWATIVNLYAMAHGVSPYYLAPNASLLSRLSSIRARHRSLGQLKGTQISACSCGLAQQRTSARLPVIYRLTQACTSDADIHDPRYPKFESLVSNARLSRSWALGTMLTPVLCRPLVFTSRWPV